MTIVPEGDEPKSLQLPSVDISLANFDSLEDAMEATREPIDRMGLALHYAFRDITGSTHDIHAGDLPVSSLLLRYDLDRNKEISIGHLTPREIETAPDSIKKLFRQLQIEPGTQIYGFLILRGITLPVDDPNGHGFTLAFELPTTEVFNGKSGVSLSSYWDIGLIPRPKESNFRSDLEKANHKFLLTFNQRLGDYPHPYLAQMILDGAYMIGNAIDVRRKPTTPEELPTQLPPG